MQTQSSIFVFVLLPCLMLLICKWQAPYKAAGLSLANCHPSVYPTLSDTKVPSPSDIFQFLPYPQKIVVLIFHPINRFSTSLCLQYISAYFPPALSIALIILQLRQELLHLSLPVTVTVGHRCVNYPIGPESLRHWLREPPLTAKCITK